MYATWNTAQLHILRDIYAINNKILLIYKNGNKKLLIYINIYTYMYTCMYIYIHLCNQCYSFSNADFEKHTFFPKNQETDLPSGSVILTKRDSMCHSITPCGESLGKMLSRALALSGSMTAPFVLSWTSTVVTRVSMISTASESSATLSARIVRVIVDRAWPSENVT